MHFSFLKRTLIVTPRFISWYTNELQLIVNRNTVYLQKNYTISCQIWTCLQSEQDHILIATKTTGYWDRIPILSIYSWSNALLSNFWMLHAFILLCLKVRCFNCLTGTKPAAQGKTQALPAAEPDWRNGWSSVQRLGLGRCLTPAPLSFSGTLRGKKKP